MDWGGGHPVGPARKTGTALRAEVGRTTPRGKAALPVCYGLRSRPGGSCFCVFTTESRVGFWVGSF